ncbi:2475_t:CDS:2 [Gigaspora margarita]|uniref:2475_t:CDS:1 n=1 Tax=Gigaspora margarita TaxID=4874 RepID=A0ABN7VU39_GIGMA|nr:2475_t:CDS:2 [Gigaspora margarita]
MQQINCDTKTILISELTGASNIGFSNQRAAATAAQTDLIKTLLENITTINNVNSI